MLKKHTNTILILGDSTSMSIGVEKLTHVFINAQNNNQKNLKAKKFQCRFLPSYLTQI